MLQVDRQVQRYHFCCGICPTYAVFNTREHKDLDSAVSRVPSNDYLFVLIDANARTDVRIGD